ncbi:protease modulator HflC [Insolitispirillum peregrinum]|uniref:Protein HflC n=1 Tax=Insolitispirillum peregrinum TaxID=80876 RepID=A0A1N7NQG0_9PROT|nr:protease modulator HflC [Insolitispirillum peregrinum]SIT00584.1 protease FtsH subunit HflC [Insolitispirillum peregrinum]
MKQHKLLLLAVAAIAVAVLAVASLFTVRQTEQAIVVQFGNPRQVIKEPGLHFKIPFIQQVLYYDSRILSLNPRGQEVPLVDQKRIIVDSFARYRIVDPLQFYKAVVNTRVFEDRFGAILNSAVRDNLGSSELADLLTEKRGTVMQNIANSVRQRSSEFGIEVLDVRIGRTDLPDQTSQSVYNRMRSSRISLAKQLRAEGEELKVKIQAEADRDRTVLLADARKNAEILRGEGDAQRNTVLADAYNRDPEFFRFYRSLDAYREALNSGTTMVLSPDSEFFKYFNTLPGDRSSR